MLTTHSTRGRHGIAFVESAMSQVLRSVSQVLRSVSWRLVHCVSQCVMALDAQCRSVLALDALCDTVSWRLMHCASQCVMALDALCVAVCRGA